MSSREGGQPTMGQSRFALARGLQFERILFQRAASTLIEALVKAAVLPDGSARFRDLRLRLNGGRSKTLKEARASTIDLVRGAVAQPNRAPALVAGATVVIPGGIVLPEALLVLDVLALRPGATKIEPIVGEIKTYPDRAGYTDPRELASARAQAGIYLHGLELVLAVSDYEMHLRSARRDPSCFRGQDRISRRSERQKISNFRPSALRGFELLRKAAAVTDPFSDPPGESGYQAVVNAQSAFDETCLSFCDRATLCRKKALAAGNAAVLGHDIARFLGGIQLPRGVALLQGAALRTDTERDLVRRMHEAKRARASGRYSGRADRAHASWRRTSPSEGVT
jgi:hypothetical protein